MNRVGACPKARSSALRWLSRALPLTIPLVAACVHDGYPLSSGATVRMQVDLGSKTLYAAESVDKDGKAVTPRQAPYSTTITLVITEDAEPAFGSFVDVTVDPPDLLELSSATDEGTDTPSCVAIDGFFRCSANDKGFAKFVVTSTGDKSGTATVKASWGKSDNQSQDIVVRPAGLPDHAGVIEITNLHQSQTIRAVGDSISCYEQGVPTDIDTEWRDGHVRVSEPLTVESTPPLDAPGAMENAPVYVRTDSATAMVSLTPDCTEASRLSEVRLLLDSYGKSTVFYACFSDLGGNATFKARTGGSDVTPLVGVEVQPEPRLIRVDNDKTQVEFIPTVTGQQILDFKPIFNVSASGVHENPVALRVKLDINDHVLQLQDQSAELGETIPGATVQAAAVATGTTQLSVTPFQYPKPTCKSKQVTVVSQQSQP